MDAALWRADLQVAADAIRRYHRNAFYLMDEAQFARAVADLDMHIPTLAKHEIVVGIQCLAAMIGDGHTRLATAELYDAYPLELMWFGDDVRVIRTVAAYQDILNTRLIAIDGMDVHAVHARLQRVIPQAENTWFVLHQSAAQMTRAQVLAALGIAAVTTHATFTFQDEQGEQTTHVIQAVPPQTPILWSGGDTLPIDRQRSDESLWWALLEDTRSLYVQFRNYHNLQHNARTLWEYIDAQTPQRLIIDMRHNGGGDYTAVRAHLLYALWDRSTLNRTGRLYIVIGRGTFSAAMTNATDFRRETDAILVGEPTGARPRGYQENHWVTLPHSGLRVSVACRLYRFQDTDIPMVEPDHLIPPDWALFQAGRDPVVEWILSQPIDDAAVNH